MAHAANPFFHRPFSLDDIGFYDPATFPVALQPKNFMRAVNGSVALSTLGSSCSAFVISDHGHVLTAGHCVRRCFNDETEIIDAGRPNLYHLRLFPPYVKAKPCFLATYDRNPFDSDRIVLAEYPVSVIAWGKGSPNFDERAIQQFTEQDTLMIRDHFSDFAILKFEKYSKLPRCIPSSLRDVAPGEKTWAIGFPGMTQRVGAPGSPGSKKVVSYGTVLSSMKQNEYYRTLAFSEQDYDKANTTYLGGGNFLSDLDLFSGSSGSVNLNSDGEVAGVNVAMAVSGEVASTQYHKGTAITAGISKIREIAKAQLSPAEYEQAFHCNR